MNWRKTRNQGLIVLDIPVKLGTLRSRAHESIRHGPEVTLAGFMQSRLGGGVRARRLVPLLIAHCAQERLPSTNGREGRKVGYTSED